MILRCLLFIFFTANCYAEVAPELLSKEVGSRISKVPEFGFIQQEARRLGIKVYLFGGTASAFAHYVRWDLEREAGDDKYQAERFDYDFTNIYRGNQDLDIVVDGTAEEAKQLQEVLQREYPHFVGDKDAWEVRLLKEQIGDKLPLLGDDDFKKQHTDSNSIGLIDITAEKPENVFKDLFMWDEVNSEFLKDIASGSIKYYFSRDHKTTRRFLEGNNPPILSAIRYLAKLTQYEIDGNPTDLGVIRSIIKGTDFNSLSGYSKYKLKEFSKKALLNSPNVENAKKLLDQVGLTPLLIRLDKGDVHKIKSLAWWFSKEPLRSKGILRSGEGETAKTLGIDIVSHETSDIQAYENITRSSQGGVNVFISRAGVSGETAAYGDGFYTRTGKAGAVGNGITIRFRVHPEARLGRDFTKHGDFIVFTNKSALTLIQENINMTEADYFKLILNGSIGDNDKGLTAKLERKFRRSKAMDEKELGVIYKLIKASMKNAKYLNHADTKVLARWFAHPESTQYPWILRRLIRVTRIKKSWVVKNVFAHEHWVPTGERYLKKWLPLAKHNTVTGEFLHIIGYEKMITTKALDERVWETVITELLSKPYWGHRIDYIENLLFKVSLWPGSYLESALSLLINAPHWKGNVELYELLIERGAIPTTILYNILLDDNLSANIELNVKFIRKFSYYENSGRLLSQMFKFHEQNAPAEVFREYANLEVGTNFGKRYLAVTEGLLNVLSRGNWYKHPKLLRELLKNRKKALFDVIDFLDKNPQWRTRPEIYEDLIKIRKSRIDLFSHFVEVRIWESYPYLFEMLVKRMSKFSLNRAISYMPKTIDHKSVEYQLGINKLNGKNLKSLLSQAPFGAWSKQTNKVLQCSSFLK